MVVGLRQFCLDVNVTLVCSELSDCTTVCSEDTCFGVTYVGWCNICNCVVISTVHVCIDNGVKFMCMAYVFHFWKRTK